MNAKLPHEIQIYKIGIIRFMYHHIAMYHIDTCKQASATSTSIYLKKNVCHLNVYVVM